MTFRNQLLACFVHLIELQFVIDDIHSLRYGIDTGLQRNLIVQEYRLVETDILRLDHDVWSGEAHPDKVRDEGIEDIPVHHTSLETLFAGKCLISVQWVHIPAAALKAIVHLLCHLIDLLYMSRLFCEFCYCHLEEVFLCFFRFNIAFPLHILVYIQYVLSGRCLLKKFETKFRVMALYHLVL